MTDLDVDPRVITNVENYHAEDITPAFTLLTGDVPVDSLKKEYAENYRKQVVNANVNVPDEYFMQWWGYDGWTYLESPA